MDIMRCVSISGWLLFLATLNNASMNICVQVPVGMASFLLIINLRVQLLGPLVSVCLTFWGTPGFSKAAAPFYILTSDLWESQFLHILGNTCYSCLFQDSYPGGCEVVLICISLCRVSCVEHLLMLNIISNSGNAICIGHLSIFFGEMSIQILCSLNFFISECKSALFIEDISPLSDIGFANAFAHFVSSRCLIAPLACLF